MKEQFKEIYLSNSETCRLHNVSRNALSEWVQKGFPIAGRSRYPLFGGMDWVRANIESGGSTLTDERTELIRVQRKLKELELLVEEGKLISREKVLEHQLSAIHSVKDALIHFHQSLIPAIFDLEPRDQEAVVKNHAWEILRTLSTRLKAGEDERKLWREFDRRAKNYNDSYVLAGRTLTLKKGDHHEEGESILGGRKIGMAATERGRRREDGSHDPGKVNEISAIPPAEIRETVKKDDEGLLRKEVAGNLVGEAGIGQAPVIPESLKFDFTKSAIKSFYNFSEETFLRVAKQAIRDGIVFEGKDRGLPVTNRQAFTKWWEGFLPGRSEAEKVNHLERYE